MQTIRNLGWANSWKETPDIVKKCRELKHQKTYESKSDRGTENVVRCEICGYVYRYDSSD